MNPPTKPTQAQHPAAGTARARGGVRRIAIGGRLLEDLQVQIDARPRGYVSYRMYPGSQYSAREDAQGVTLWLPALAALKLYHEGVLPGDRLQPVELTLGRRRIGPLFVHGLQVEDSQSVNEHVLLRLERQPAAPEQPRDKHQWVRDMPRLALHARGESGARTQWEMERALPPKVQETLAKACAHIDAGRLSRAEPMLDRLGLLYLDVIALQGELSFRHPNRSGRVPYETAILIGRHTLGEGFDGLLPWAFEGNRAFLRSLHGLALCLWREDRFEEAEDLLRELLAFDPADALRAGEMLALVSRDQPYSARFIPAR
jgi:hypothetical protein